MKTRVNILKVTATILFLFFLCAHESKAQYVNSGLKLINTLLSSVHWVDIDGDGDLDASVSGSDKYTFANGQGKLYFFQSNVLFDSIPITPLKKGDMTWCDFNNDNIPDLLYSGENSAIIAGIDTFSISDNAFHNYFSGLQARTESSVDWGDYDNDGDYDILLSGRTADNNIITTIYQNNNGSFTDIMAGLPGIINGKIGFIDFDLDQDLDIFISGQDINTNKYTRLWENNGGIYSITSDQFVNLSYSRFEWGDFNSDGYPDLLLGGNDGSQIRGLLYMNNSGISFSLSDTIVPGSNYGGTGFGDVDNDGDLDVHCSGGKQNSVYNGNVIYINDGSDSLKPATFTMNPLLITNYQFGDYDNDDDLDFIINGYNNGPGSTKIYKNTSATVKYKPDPPQNLTATVSGPDVILSWDRATDNNTPSKALTYNIYVGTTSMGVDIVSPQSDISNGFRRISKQGYIRDTAWIIKNLPIGIYYWGVQSIDNSLAASSFSVENSFEIKTRFTETAFSEVPNTTTPAAYFDYDYDNDYDLFLAGENKSIVSVNTGTGFSHDNYDTIYSEAFTILKTFALNDYDNNNIPDFSASGDYSGNISFDSSIVLFGRRNGADYDIISSALAKNADFEYVLWNDLNNDGLQDMITSGKTNNLGINDKPVTYIFKNEGNGSFSKVSHTIRGFEDCGAVSADFDNDMDIDLVIYGRDSLGILNTYLYNNSGDFNFIESNIPNNQLYRYLTSYNILVGDYDLNGEIDIYMAGRSSQGDNYARVLLNHNMIFSDANLPIRSWKNMSDYWADYDYDGDLDIFSVSTYSTTTDGVRLYINKNQVLEEQVIDLGDIHQLDLPFQATNIDNKNGLDFVMKINDGDYVQFFDNYSIYDKIVTPPTNLNFERSGLDVILKWEKVADCPGCTYNIWIGTHHDSVNIMSPMADKVTGFRYLIQPGNAFLNNRWKISGLPADTCYWSVQAVDLANTGGPWAEMASFILVNVSPEFTYDTVCLGNTNHFYDLSVATDAVNKWKWNFGDGTGSTLQNPQHLYTSAGTFTVGLWAYSLSGDSALKTHDIIVRQKPAADFSVSIACLGNSNIITNNTNSNGLPISGWLWDYGDATLPYTGQNPGSHGYINPGNYNILLKVTADNACMDSISRVAQVVQYPVTTVSADNTLTFCTGDSVTFSVPYNSQYTYQWKLNGTNISNADSGRHTAKITGSYTVEATNPVGSCTKISDPQALTVQSLPPSYSIGTSGPVTFCQGDSVILSVTPATGYSYQWRLNGGSVGSNSNQYMAKVSGSYDLVVSNSSSCTATSVAPVAVTVKPLPVSNAISLTGSSKFCNDQSSTLSVPVNAGYSYSWKNGTSYLGLTTNSVNVTESGDYTVEVSLDGCMVTPNPLKIEVILKPAKPDIDMGSYTNGMCLGEDPVKLSVDNVVAVYSYQWYKNETPLSVKTTIDVAEAGNYYLEAVTDICSSERDTAVISFAPAPSKPDIIARGPSVWLLSTTSKADKYKWYINGSPIPEADQSRYLAGQNYGLYRLAVADESGCFSFSDTLRIPLGITGIEDTDPFKDVKIYPNPTTGLFTIEMNNNVFGELVIDIITQNGSKILNIKFEKTTEHFSSQIDLSGQSKGMYLINMKIDKYIATRKILVE